MSDDKTCCDKIVETSTKVSGLETWVEKIEKKADETYTEVVRVKSYIAVAVFLIPLITTVAIKIWDK